MSLSFYFKAIREVLDNIFPSKKLGDTHDSGRQRCTTQAKCCLVK